MAGAMNFCTGRETGKQRCESLGHRNLRKAEKQRAQRGLPLTEEIIQMLADHQVLRHAPRVPFKFPHPCQSNWTGNSL